MSESRGDSGGARHVAMAAGETTAPLDTVGDPRLVHLFPSRHGHKDPSRLVLQQTTLVHQQQQQPRASQPAGGQTASSTAPPERHHRIENISGADDAVFMTSMQPISVEYLGLSMDN